MHRITHTLNPIIDECSEVLILGSMPGTESLNRGEYYAHPRNHFWPILYGVFNEPFEIDYLKRIEFLQSHKLAVWDVIASCMRKGSLDSTISGIVVNDIAALLQQYPGIKLIILNGTKAESTFRKYFSFDGGYSVRVLRAPSTSPIPGKNVKTYEEKMKEWARILSNGLEINPF